MWPSMFGPGWPWGVLVVLAFVALMGLCLAWVVRSERPPAMPGTPPDDPWHRYEEGDLTRQEFERLRRRRAA
jgi:hypothetical protein